MNFVLAKPNFLLMNCPTAADSMNTRRLSLQALARWLLNDGGRVQRGESFLRVEKVLEITWTIVEEFKPLPDKVLPAVTESLRS